MCVCMYVSMYVYNVLCVSDIVQSFVRRPVCVCVVEFTCNMPVCVREREREREREKEQGRGVSASISERE